jgi:hypothetical protein
MVKPRQVPSPDEEPEDDDMETIAPLPRSPSGGESELDEYIHLGEQKTPEEDMFPDVPEEEEEDTAPIPRIERDTKLEEEIEQ